MAQPPNQPAPTKPKERVISFKTKGNNKLIDYVLTQEDWLTLARAVEFEGPPQQAVAWSLIQRFAYLYPLYPTLERFIKAYAQPINPRWFPDGVEHKKWHAYLIEKGRVAEADKEVKQAAMRVTKAQTPLSKISAKNIAVIESMFATGAPSPIPSSVHYRAPTVQTKDRAVAAAARAEFAAKKQLLDTVKVGDPTKENWFFSETGARLLNVSVRLQDATAKNVILLLALGGLALWLVYKVQGTYA